MEVTIRKHALDALREIKRKTDDHTHTRFNMPDPDTDLSGAINWVIGYTDESTREPTEKKDSGFIRRSGE